MIWTLRQRELILVAMELASLSLPPASLSKPLCSSSSFLSSFRSTSPSLLCDSGLPFRFSKSFLSRLQLQCVSSKSDERKRIRPIRASDAQFSTSNVADRWILLPVGDGNCKHIGYKVQLPDAFEIASDEVTVGRLPDKADIVIPVATVSGLHARIQKKGEKLLVTDMDSTNGTFINEKRLRPGVVEDAPPGSFLIFGDIHLAMYRVSKLENAGDGSKPEEETETIESDGSNNN